jgi:hypothetical protein
MTDEPKAMLTLAEEVARVLSTAPKPLTLAQVKSALKQAGIRTTGQGRVTDAEIEAALNAEGVFQHPPTTARGKPAYWNRAPKSAEETAAEAAASKAAKAADAERRKLEKAIRELNERVHTKILEVGDKVAAPSALGRPSAKAKPELHAEFERILATLLQEKRLFEHPGGKYARKPYEPPRPPNWYEKSDAKRAIAAFVKAAEKLLEIEGATREWLIERLPQGKPAQKPSPEPLDLNSFAADVLGVARKTPPEYRFYDSKVFISAAWRASQESPGFPKMGLEEFKRHLVEANRQHLLNLGRADEVALMNAELVRASETLQLTHTFHFILV